MLFSLLNLLLATEVIGLPRRPRREPTQFLFHELFVLQHQERLLAMMHQLLLPLSSHVVPVVQLCSQLESLTT